MKICHLPQHDAQVPCLQQPLYPQRPHLLQAQQHLLGKYQVIIRHYKTFRTAFAIQIFIVSVINANLTKDSIFIDVTVMTVPPGLPLKETSFKTVTLNRALWTPGSVTAAREAWALRLILEKLRLKLTEDMPG